MAQFNADIALDLITGPAEREVKKLESKIDRLERKAGDINVKFDVDDQEIRRADRLLDNLEQTRRVKLQIDERVNRSSSGSPSGGGGNAPASNAAALIPGIAAGASVSEGIKEASKELKAAVKAVTPLETATEKVVENIKKSNVAAGLFKEGLQESKNNARKLALINEEIERSYTTINDKTNRYKAQLGNIKRIDTLRRRLTKDENIEREESVQKAKELFSEIRKAVKEQDKLADRAAEYNRRATQVSGRFQAPGLPPKPPSGGGGRGGRGGGGGNSPLPAVAGGALGGLKANIVTAIASLVGLNEALQETRRIIDATLTRTQGEQRIKALAAGFDDYTAVLERSNAAAQKFNISQNQANAAFGQLYGRLRPLGLTIEEINTVYEGFNTAAVLSGTTATEASGAMLQLSQALGAGALRGEEFNSIAEQTPAITRAIAKQLDVPIGQLKEMAKEGRITSDVVVAALAAIKTEGADRLNSALDSPTQKVQKLTNRFEDLRVEIGKTTLPAFIKIVEGGTTIVEDLTDDVNKLGLALAYLNRQLPGVDINLGKVFDRMFENFPIVGRYIKALNFAIDALAILEQQKRDNAKGPRNFGENYKERERRLFEAAGGYTPYKEEPQWKRLGLPDPNAPLDDPSVANSAADLAARQLEAGQELSREFSRQLRLLRATSDLERDLLQIEFDREDRMRSIANAAADMRAELTALSNGIATSQIQDAAQDSFGRFFADEQARLDSLFGAMDTAQSEFEEFYNNLPKNPFEELFEQSGQRVASALNDTIGTAIEGLISGADDLNQKLLDIASTLLRDVGRLFLKAGISGLGQSFNIPGFAKGGTLGMNRVGVVGEDGPEIIVTRPTGTTITPLTGGGADPFVEAGDALTSGGTSQAFVDAGEALQMASMTRANNSAIQQEQREATALESGENSLKIGLDTTVINGVEYATVDQVLQASQRSAKQAEANMYRAMKNLPHIRKKTGLQ